MAKVLVVGGAGYVGSAFCAWLLDRGAEPWILDDLSTGHRELVLGARFVRGRAGDRSVVLPLLEEQRFDCVMHFAARALVAESVANPQLYFENNVEQTRALLGFMREAGLKRFVFSSTCAIFGDPGDRRISEDLPKNPINPYGQTKLEAEQLLQDAAAEWGLRAVVLRYFNAAGAEPGGRVGEWHEPETHLIPRILQAAARNEAVEIYGTDFPTRDGTCVRDYIHVTDLAEAHEAAMRLLLTAEGGRFAAFNLGTENGCSVREIIAAAGQVLGRKLAVVEKPRRAGDPPQLVADSARARAELGFKPRFGIEAILSSAHAWEGKRRATRSKRAVFLDRDGTLNLDPGYMGDPAQMALLPHVGEALSLLKQAGFELIVVSNQSGVGRGLISPEAIPRIHDRLDELLSKWSVAIDHFELCFHRPDEDCPCRKPKPKLLLDAAEKRGIDLSRSFMVGDKWSDIDSGFLAGCRGSLLVRTGQGVQTEAELASGAYPRNRLPAFRADTLLDAAHWILAQG